MSQSQKIFTFGVSKKLWMDTYPICSDDSWLSKPVTNDSLSYIWIQMLGVGCVYSVMLHEYSQTTKKFMNGYLGIHTDGLKCLNLWNLNGYLGIFFINIDGLHRCQNQKILTLGGGSKMYWQNGYTPPYHHPPLTFKSKC